MAYQFYNDTATLKVVENGQAKNLTKSLVSLTVQGNDLVIGYDSNENWLRVAYTNVTVPSSVSAEALRSTLNGYLVETISTTIDTTGLATEAKQDDQITIITSIDDKIKVDTDDDDIAVEQELPLNISLMYGWEEEEGGTWERLHTDTEGRLKVQVDALPLANGAATEATLSNIEANQINGTQKTQIVDAGGEAATVTSGKLDVNATIDSTLLAKEAKQDTQITLATTLNGYVDGLETLLTSLNSKDFATETTLNLIKGYVDNIETILTEIDTNTTGLNLEATQLLIKGVLDLIKVKTDNLDVALSTRASETTLIQIRDYLDTVETKLASLITNTNGLALESTLTALNAKLNSLGQKTSANSTPVVLPSDQVVNISTVTTTPPLGGQIGSYVDANKVFSFAIDVTAASSGTNNPLITINNPLGSGKKLSVFAFYGGCSVSNVSVKFKIFANPTITVAGTAQNAKNNNVGNATASVAVIKTLPTVSSNGIEIRNMQIGQNVNSGIMADSGSLTINENNTILITADPLSNNRNCVITLLFIEI